VAFAVGRDGTILRRDDLIGLAGWSRVPSETDEHLWSVWGSGPSDVFAVGSWGTVVHFDGSEWSPMSSGTPPTTLTGVWGSGPADVFAVSSYGVLHYDGQAWSEMADAPAGLLAVWGSGPTDVFAAGYHGAIHHFDGTTWQEMSSATTMEIWSIWGSGPTDVYAAGRRESAPGGVVHFDGLHWQTVQTGQSLFDPRVHGSGPNDVWIADDRLVHFDGSRWHEGENAIFPARSVFCIDSRQVLAVGGVGAIARRRPEFVGGFEEGDTSEWSAVGPPALARRDRF
jgi:hypothetical protein